MKNSQKGFVVPMLLVIIALLVVGGGVYYMSTKNTSTLQDTQENNDQSPQVQVNQNNSPITITFPTAGATLVEGKTYNIVWTNSNNASVNYGLYVENDKAGSIRIEETSQKSYSWTVPSILGYMNGGDKGHDVAPVDGYRISVTDLTNSKVYYSQVFKIIPTSSINVSLDMTNEYAQKYKTTFTAEFEKPANFDSHFRIVLIGCGTSCGNLFALDKNNGKVYFAASTNGDYEIVNDNQIRTTLNGQNVIYMFNPLKSEFEVQYVG